MSAPPPGIRRSRLRDRHGRGMRGPAVAPGVRHPAQRSGAERFDAIAIGLMRELWRRWPEALGHVELGVEEVPIIPETWHGESIPLSTYVAARGDTPARLVLLRRPIEHRALHPDDLRPMILTVLIDQVAEILGIDPDDVLPDLG